MSKRPAQDDEQTSPQALKAGDRPIANSAIPDGENFEDEFEDEFESEDEILEAGVDGRPDEEREAEQAESGAMDVDKETFIPGRHKLDANQTLSPDLSTYEMLHSLETTWPCLSFDIVRDQLGDDRKSYPATVYAVAGTQAAQGRERENQLMVMKLSGLSRNDEAQNQDSDDESDDEDQDDDAILETKAIPLTSTTNRIRAHQSPQVSSSAPPTTITASWQETGDVLIHDVTPHLQSFDTPEKNPQTMAPSTSKRLKSLKISRHFLIGNTAVQLPHPSFPNPPEGHSKGWKVYVRPLPNGPDISTWLKKVQFKLHHTYADASRTIEAPGPFEISETGYGEFGVEIRLYFPPESGEKAQYREHYLVLGTYGSEEQQERQRRENSIVAERVETIEFNEPTADFFKTLTSEEQYAWLKTKKGRGKGKKAEMVFHGDVPPSAQLPEKAVGGPVGDAVKGMEAGKGGVWSAQYERQLVSQLEASEKQLLRMIDEEKSAAEARKARMAELGKKIDAKG